MWEHRKPGIKQMNLSSGTEIPEQSVKNENRNLPTRFLLCYGWCFFPGLKSWLEYRQARLLCPACIPGPNKTKQHVTGLKCLYTSWILQEDNREIPVMANSEYGHRLLACPEPFKRSPHGRRMVLYYDQYRHNGVSLV